MTAKQLYTQLQAGKFIIAGPCALENFDLALNVAKEVKTAAKASGLFPIFKSSWDKANRSSGLSFRGPGLELGLSWLAEIKKITGLPIITDVHLPEHMEPVAQVADILQIPAFLCRQTDLLQAAAKTGKIVNVKKGQFVAPWDMAEVKAKLLEAGNDQILLTERGASFGYNNLVVDFRSFSVMRSLGVPVIFDATHSVQLPGGLGKSSGGERQYVPHLACAAVAYGVDGVFLECHPNPDQALCDGPNSLHLQDLAPLLQKLSKIWSLHD